jgi:hypothetical protein
MSVDKNDIMNGLCDLYCSPNVSLVNILGHVEGLGGTETAYKSVTGKPEMQNFAATKSYAEQLRDWYWSPNITGVITSGG